MAQTSDADRLGMAIEYFQTGKYHECLLLMEKLDAQYRLNPRFRAYLGVCYYYEWDYEKACRCLDEVLPQLSAFAPSERSVYLWSCAESHFNLSQYALAIPLYRERLTVCHENEKPDTYYRLGFCYMFLSDWQQAHDNMAAALELYKRYPSAENEARMRQTANMLAGIDARLPKPEPQVDTLTTASAVQKSDTLASQKPLAAAADALGKITVSSLQPSPKPDLTVKKIAVKPLEIPIPKQKRKPAEKVSDINLDQIYRSGVEVK